MAIYRGTGGSAEATNSATVNEVAGYAADAETSATSASASATSAASSATAAASSATTSNFAAASSESSATASATSASASSASASNSSTSASQAAASASSAATSASNAAASAINAASSETAVASSAASAAASASSASISATNASNNASAAATSASASSVSADEAAASAASIVGSVAEATTKASEAAASAANAESAWDSFDDRYLGAKATEPTVDNDGNALVVGTMYFDSTNNVTMLYNGTEWQAASSSIDGIKTDFVYTATAGQTVFSGNDDNTNELVIDKVGLANVYLNGVRLSDSDYTASAPSNSITLSTGASVGDIVEVEVFGNFAGQSGADVAITGGSITGVTLNATGFTSTGIDDNATSTAITIDTNENVGIGTASPDSKLEVVGGVTVGSFSGNGYRISRSGSSLPIIEFGTLSADVLSMINPVNSPLVLGTNNTERARIDSSGNLLVGQTSATAGYKFQVTGLTQISGADTNIRMGQLDSTYSYIQSTRGGTNGDIKIFGGLHPQDGVYLGGTGAANKLDDYEEGTWTPTAIGITSAGVATYNIYRNGYYTKVGNMVHAHGIVGWGAHTGSGALAIVGLPFPTSNSTYNYTAVTIGEYNGLTLGVNNYLTGTMSGNSSTIALQRVDTSSGASTVAQVNLDTAVNYIVFSVTYKTDS